MQLTYGLPMALCWVLYYYKCFILKAIFEKLIGRKSTRKVNPMPKERKRRLTTVLLVSTSLALAVGLSLFALRRYVHLYYTPSQLAADRSYQKRMIRVGGIVVPHTVWQRRDQLTVRFEITDFQHVLKVSYRGILPALFKEGQGVVVEGHFDRQGLFIARRVLAKHDARYRPPGIAKYAKRPL